MRIFPSQSKSHEAERGIDLASLTTREIQAVALLRCAASSAPPRRPSGSTPIRMCEPRITSMSRMAPRSNHSRTSLHDSRGSCVVEARAARRRHREFVSTSPLSRRLQQLVGARFDPLRHVRSRRGRRSCGLYLKPPLSGGLCEGVMTIPSARPDGAATVIGQDGM